MELEDLQDYFTWTCLGCGAQITATRKVKCEFCQKCAEEPTEKTPKKDSEET